MNTLAVSLVAGVLGNPGIPYYGPNYQYIPHVGPGDAYVARGGERADGCHKYQVGQPGYAVHMYGKDSPDARGYTVPRGCE
jgi:hypothetical protein